MKINTNVRYGLRALIEIGKNQGPVLQKKIAEKQEIPLNYLDSIITGLKNAGLIINQGGKGSGYILARKPEEISVYHIYRAFSPELQLVNCFCETNECHRSLMCPAKDVWFEMNARIKEFMESRTLKEMIEYQ